MAVERRARSLQYSECLVGVEIVEAASRELKTTTLAYTKGNHLRLSIRTPTGEVKRCEPLYVERLLPSVLPTIAQTLLLSTTVRLTSACVDVQCGCMERRTGVGAEVHGAESYRNCTHAAVADFSLQGAGPCPTAWQLQYSGKISVLPLIIARRTVHPNTILWSF